MCVRERERKRERERERRSELEACLASFRLCNVSAAAGSDGRKLLLCVSLQLFCPIMSAFCLITAHLQPDRRCTHSLLQDRPYKPLFGGERNAVTKKGLLLFRANNNHNVCKPHNCAGISQQRPFRPTAATRLKKRKHLVHL